MRMGRLTIATALVIVATAGSAAAAGPGTTRVSLTSSGTQAGRSSDFPTISADGRYVAFHTDARLVPGDTNDLTDVYVRDLASGSTRRVSNGPAGADPDAGAYFPRISADGRYVAYESNATNLVPGDTNATTDVFVQDGVTGRTERVSVSSAGAQSDAFSYNPTISADGRYIAFESGADNLVDGDTNGVRDVFVRDRIAGQTTRVSVSSAGAQGGRFSYGPSISADGQHVAFTSLAADLVPADTNRLRDVFVRDMATGQTRRVSVTSAGAQANGSSGEPSLSADGRSVAFTSSSHNLVADDTNRTRDVFRHDSLTGATERMSVTGTGNQVHADSFTPAISRDGQHVAFASRATRLAGPDTNGAVDVFVRDVQAGRTERVSVGDTGKQGNNFSAIPAISGDGRFVAFVSSATNLVVGDTNLATDIFVRDRVG